MIEWRSIPGSPDFVSDGLVAVYKRTDRGQALYWVFLDSTPRRFQTQRNAISAGGLPCRLPQHSLMRTSDESVSDQIAKDWDFIDRVANPGARR